MQDSARPGSARGTPAMSSLSLSDIYSSVGGTKVGEIAEREIDLDCIVAVVGLPTLKIYMPVVDPVGVADNL